jgi:GNAT superfamily N-acetyltransferase
VSADPSPPATAPEPRLHELADGTRVLVRPLVQSDRAELVARYEALSSQSRRLRFVSAPAHLSDRLLDHLFDVDYVDRHALVATLVDEPGAPSVGVARYFRSHVDPTAADAAVTVVDECQGRGIGTLLLTSLVADAAMKSVAGNSVIHTRTDAREAPRCSSTASVIAVHQGPFWSSVRPSAICTCTSGMVSSLPCRVAAIWMIWSSWPPTSPRRPHSIRISAPDTS